MQSLLLMNEKLKQKLGAQNVKKKFWGQRKRKKETGAIRVQKQRQKPLQNTAETQKDTKD